MGTFRKKPVEIEAFQFDEVNGDALVIWIAKHNGSARWHYGSEFEDGNQRLFIDTLEGTMTAELGDMIIKGVKDEFYPCKPDIFEATYDKVD
jgi:hypothetical protein